MINVGSIQGNAPNFTVELDSGSRLRMASDLRVKQSTVYSLPFGTEAQRPSYAYPGSIRYNETSDKLEIYTGTTWERISKYNV